MEKLDFFALPGHQLVIIDAATHRQHIPKQVFMINSVSQVPYQYMRLANYPTNTTLHTKEDWELLLRGKPVWIHDGEILCYLYERSF